MHEWAQAPAGGRPAPSRYDAWKDLVAAVQAWEVAKGRSKYDPFASVSSWQAPTGRSKYCAVAAALDAAAGWEPPRGTSPYDPMPALLALEAPTKAASAGAWDPLAWLLDGWAANSGDWQVGGASQLRNIEAPTGSSKFDPAAGGALRSVSAPSRRAAKYDPLKDVLAGQKPAVLSWGGQRNGCPSIWLLAAC